jgi:hypothetical protein
MWELGNSVAKALRGKTTQGNLFPVVFVLKSIRLIKIR